MMSGVGGYYKREQAKQDNLTKLLPVFAQMNMITSFCTAGYRCGRTGDKIMCMLNDCTEGKFCKLNAVLTFREYLDDYASQETKAIGESLINKEIEEIQQIPFYYLLLSGKHLNTCSQEVIVQHDR